MQGLSPNMRKIRGYKLKALKVLDNFSDTIKDVVDSSLSQQSVQKHEFTLSINQLENAGTVLDVKVSLLS